ncbi:MAG: cation transporter, partial [archaeon]
MGSEFNVKVKGMHCKSCAELIKGGLLKLNGIEKAEASFAEEKVSVSFDAEIISEGEIKEQLTSLGYPPSPSPAEGTESQGHSSSFAVQPKKSIKGSALMEGIIFGLTPHIGCIGFIAASVLGATIAVELFKPLLMNPWFFHFLVLLSLAFATISSALYLNKNGILSWNGIKRKKAYLATMYGLTIGVNLFLFLAVFPAIANLDTGSFANPTGNIVLAG